MKKINLFLGIALVLCSQLLNAQDIFKQYGFTKEPLTLSNGNYNEFFNNDEVVQIGTVLMDTKTNKVVAFIKEETDTTYRAELSSRWLSPDPLAAKYPQFSPYTYCANNPIIYIDPDGNDLLIWYKNDQGKAASYRYTGGDVSHTNSFVNKVIEAYNYNVSNGGGKAMQTAATDNSVTVGITEYNDSKSWDGNTYWNPDMGLETKEGDVLSPATVLEHEVDHSYDEKKNPSEHEKRVGTKDGSYTNAEEKRVITGNETKTAKANGEIGNKSVSRGSHHGNKKVIVNGGATSTNVNQQKTNEHNKKLEEQNGNWSSEW